jgi:hypothetical protein
MRSQRAAVAVTILLSLLCLASGASVVGTPTPSATLTKGVPTHTLVITAQNGSGGSYTVTASSTLQLKRGEQRDYQLGGPRVSGTIGERGDSRDVIRYQGHIESFQAEGSIRVTLDGHQIAPNVLGGQYIQISRSGNASQPVRYQFGVTGQVSRGARAEQTDTVTGNRIHGRVRAVDSFYFTGTIANDTISVAGPAQIQINGQPAHVFLTHAPPTSTSTPTATSTPTPPATATPSPPRTPPAPTPVSTPASVTPPPTSPSSTTTPSSTMTDAGDRAARGLVRLVHGVGGTLIIGIAAIVAVLYLLVSE